MNAQEKALLNSLEHWKDNERTFAICSILYVAFDTWRNEWWYSNCSEDQCALCAIYERCEYGCPLDNGECSTEYSEALEAMAGDDLQLSHITTVRERLEKECKERNLI